MASRDSGRISSSSPIAPTTLPSAMTCSTVMPSAAQLLGRGIRRKTRPRRAVAARRPPRLGRPRQRPRRGRRAPRSRPRHPGDPASLRGGDDRAGERVLGVRLDGGRESEDLGLVVTGHARHRRPTPVSVPVLSKITTSSSRARSSARRFLTSRPLRAPSEVEIAITSGMARPRACGQAMTRTVAVRTSAPSVSPTATMRRRSRARPPSAT